MTKLDIADIREALKISKIEPQKQQDVLNYLEGVIKNIEDHKDNNGIVKVKNEFGIIILDEMGEIKQDLAGLIYQIKVGDSHDDVNQKISNAIKEFNQTKKGIKNPIKSVTEAFKYISPKIWKNNGILRKTKEITRVIKSLNKA